MAGQSFDITHVPNGTYYIEVTANPEKVLYETTTSNDVSLRQVILGGTPGHRTVKVPAFHGIDPEPYPSRPGPARGGAGPDISCRRRWPRSGAPAPARAWRVLVTGYRGWRPPGAWVCSARRPGLVTLIHRLAGRPR